MRPFLFVAVVMLLSCNGQREENNLESASASMGQKQVSDGSYERFIDSVVYKHGLTFGIEILDAHHIMGPDDDGNMVAPSGNIAIGKAICLQEDILCVNMEGCGQYFYDIDTAIAFSLAGKKYAYLLSRSCDILDTCRDVHHFIYDYQYKRLHLFKMECAPTLNTHYFGDINLDGELDFMAVQCNYIRPKTYADTIETVLLTYYSLNTKGYFEAKKDGSNKSNILIAQFSGSFRTPRNFRVIGEFWR